jgi:acyl-CoA thioester hydrolase
MPELKDASAEVVLKIPFYDVDMMRVAWHGHYLKYFERARCALLDKLQYNYAEMEASGYIWPIVDCRLKYIKSARFNRDIRVRATLTEYENRLGMDYLITDVESGERLTTGHSIQVAVEAATGEMCYASPALLLEKVQRFLRGG